MPFGFITGIFGAIKWLLGKITLKGFLIVAAIGLLGFSQWELYSYGKHTQAIKDNVVITRYKNDAAISKKRLSDYVTDIKYWHDTADKAERDLTTLQTHLNQSIAQGIKTANDRAAAAWAYAHKQKGVVHYVTVHDDSLCTIHTGFVQLFNDAIEDPGFGQSGSIPYGGSFFADTPTTLKLSQVSNVLIVDLSEAVRRGRIIDQWQHWYLSTKANWDKVNKIIHAAAPDIKQVSPPLPIRNTTTSGSTP